MFEILGVIKRNSLFLHEIEWKNNGFLFTTPNIIYIYIYMYIVFFNLAVLFDHHFMIKKRNIIYWHFKAFEFYNIVHFM